MKHPFRSHILPFFTIGAGALGFALRLWLFSAIDEKGLLPAKHPAGVLLFILSAVVLGVLFLATRQIEPRNINKKGLLYSKLGAYFLGCIGLVCNSLTGISGSTSKLAMPAMILGIIGGLTMLCMAVLEFRSKRIPYWLSVIFTVSLMVQTVAQCQVWGAEPQLQVYFFPLMASVFLILSAYHKTARLARKGKRASLAFFSQSAAFFCCLSFNSTHGIYYLGMFLWAALQLASCLPRKKEA